MFGSNQVFHVVTIKYKRVTEMEYNTMKNESNHCSQTVHLGPLASLRINSRCVFPLTNIKEREEKWNAVKKRPSYVSHFTNIEVQRYCITAYDYRAGKFRFPAGNRQCVKNSGGGMGKGAKWLIGLFAEFICIWYDASDMHVESENINGMDDKTVENVIDCSCNNHVYADQFLYVS